MSTNRPMVSLLGAMCRKTNLDGKINYEKNCKLRLPALLRKKQYKKIVFSFQSQEYNTTCIPFDLTSYLPSKV